MDENNDKIVVQIDEDLEDLIPMFLENRQKDIGKIKQAVEEQDFDTIRTLGHSMKGTGGGYGFAEISEIGGVMETSALAKDIDSILKMNEKLISYLQKIEIVFVEDI